MRKPWHLAPPALLWLVSRAVLVWLLLGPQAWVTGDVSYFDTSLDALPEMGLEATLVEYPLPAVAVVAAPWLLAALTGLGYGVVLIGVAVLTDLAFTVLLALHRSSHGVLAWVLAVPALGATSYARFDLLPGVLCGAAVLLLATRPRLAAGCAAVATAVKLWPALLLPGVLARARPRGAAALVVVGTGAGLALLSLVAAGWGRLVSPLTYQAERGLQIESVLATPVMVGWAAVPDSWQVGYAPSNSYEITGPGVDLLLGVSRVATVLYVVALAVGWSRLWRARDRVTVATTVWLALAAVAGFVVVGKVLSPQYLLWLLPVAAAGVTVTSGRTLRVWTVGLVAAAALTQVVFPATYEALTYRSGPVWPTVTALGLRNVLVVVMLAGASWQSLAGLRRDGQRGSALDRQAPGPERYDARSRR